MRYFWVMMVLSGCATIINGRPEVVTWQEGLMSTASFQLNCPRSKLDVVDLGGGEKAGVSGCGQRATYIYVGHRDWDRADYMTPVIAR